MKIPKDGMDDSFRSRLAFYDAKMEVQSIAFDGDRFTRAQAEGWASLHGFDHGDVRATEGWIVIAHRPQEAFDEFDAVVLTERDGVRARVGRQVRAVEPASARLVYLRSAVERQRYERFSARLRFRAIMDVTRVAQGAEATSNLDWIAWYRGWFLKTHRGASRHEIDVANAVMEGLGQATRAHACDYVRKLGVRRTSHVDPSDGFELRSSNGRSARR